MATAILRFYEELNGFLSGNIRKTDTEIVIHDNRSVKDTIEAMGVPHTEIDLILVNGKSVDFNHIVRGGDRISVYPVFESLNIENVTRLRKVPLRKTRFIADTGLGEVVKLMRVLGFDVCFDPSLSIYHRTQISKEENRIILTKRRRFFTLEDVTHAIRVHPGSPREQVQRILDLLDIQSIARPFSRCIFCNGLLEPHSKQPIPVGTSPKSHAFCNVHMYCKTCGQIYGSGTYSSRMQKAVEDLLSPRKTQEFSK